MGVFNLNQINDLLNSTELKISEDLKDEIMEFLKNEGNPSCFLNSRRAAVRKGIPVSKDLYEYLPISKSLKKIYNSRNEG